MAEIDFKTLKLTWKPNQFLIAPEGFCENANPHMTSKIYDVPIEALREAFLGVVKRQPRTMVVEKYSQGARLVQKSRIFRFPDLIDVRYLAVGDDRSTLAVYSRAKLGVRDFGVNEARVKAWLAELDGLLAPV